VCALDFAGQIVWVTPLGVPKSAYGYAASLTTHRGRLVVQLDQGTAKDGKSRLIALDTATGEIVWQTPRNVPNSWSSPIFIEHDGQPRIITCGDPWVIAYAAADGAEIWRAKCLRQDVGPSPVAADGVVYVASEFPCLSAIRAGGRGDVTETHILWTAEVGLPDTCSPLATDQFLLLLASYGTLTCYDKVDGGEPLWEMDYDDGFRSSPSLAGNHAYLVGESGKSWIVGLGREGGQIVSQADLGEPCVTSPAFQDGRIFMRGEEHLFCIGK
jgi:outer membrane protein assembly factor BamB